MRFKELVTIVVGITLLAVLFSHCPNSEPCQPQRDTIIDTIRVAQPVAVDSVVVRHKIVPIYRYSDSVRVVVRDSIIIHDSVAVVPITQMKYQDSTYTAWVSGYEPCLDSIRVYQREVKTKQSRWSISLQGGVGLTPKGVQPYVGIGVSYRLK